jgi:hypothetical protein
MTIGLASTIVIATAIILLTSNTAIINAQQFTNQTGEVTQNETTTATTTLFESRNDSFRVQVPQGWVIDDVNNTGSTLESELTQGYGILAELCPEEEGGGEGQQQQEQQALTNVSSSSNSNSNSNSNSTSICQQQQQAQDEILHIVRYPNLSARLQLALGVSENDTTAEDILSYHLQKLEEVGYRSIQIVNNTDTTVNVTNAETNETIEIVPARFVEMTYATNFAPNEIREGYFISTATNATDPDPGVTKAYTVFYEGNSTTANVTSVAQTTTTSDNFQPPLPAPVRQVFDSFELVAAEEVAQTEEEGGGGPTINDNDDSGGGTTDDNDDNDNDDSGGGTTNTTNDDDDGDTGGGGPTINDNDDSGGGPANLLTAEIVSNGTQGVAPATFEFGADVVAGTAPYTYSWDFGDGTSIEVDDDETISYTFDLGGSYNVDLTVIDSSGQSASDSVEITIEEPSPPPEAEDQEQEEQQEQAAETVCDSSYPDLCIPPPPPDLDCGDDGVPENFQVLPPDPHGFDSDNDGIGCDSESNDAVVEPESSNNDSGTNVGRTSSDDDDKNAAADDDDA